MKTRFLKLALVIAATLALGTFTVHGFIPDDADGDGVPDSTDACPAVDASGFDRDGDGCIDAFIGARHVEYWGAADATITYVINSIAAPNITNGSDITAIQAAVDAWGSQADTDLNVVYGGTTPQAEADGLDRINLVTFLDSDYPFSNLVLAVGLTTSFESDTLIDGRVWREGEIYDADMLFNPLKTFKTDGAGPGTDLQGVATHEAGHLFGLSHSAIQSATMFYALPGGIAARSLEDDDRLVFFKAYGEENALDDAPRLDVTVTDGQSNDPVPGVIVYVINSQTNDTTACDYTLPNGTATFPGLDPGSYYVSIHALDGAPEIGFIQPGNVNALLVDIATAAVVAESYDNNESNDDDANDRNAVSVGNGATSVEIITNIDADGPVVLSVVPQNNTADVGVDAAYVVEFSEPVDINTIQPAFSFRRNSDQSPRGGNLAVLRNSTKIVFTPSPPLEFATDYTLRFDTDLEDRFGNSLENDVTLGVTTEDEPPLSITSLSPSKGVVGNTVVITGRGFDTNPSPQVFFNGLQADVSQGSVGRLVVDVPANAVTGQVTVVNADNSVSNGLTFTVLNAAEVARGYDSGQVFFDSEPRAIALSPDAAYAYVALADGGEAIDVGSASLTYLSTTAIPYPGGFVDFAVTPSGRRAYALAGGNNELVEIMADATTGLLFNTVLSAHDVGAAPLGLVIDPSGYRAYIATGGAEIIGWDINLGSVSYQQEVASLRTPNGEGLKGEMAINPAGNRLLALTDTGVLLFYALPEETLITTLNVGADPVDLNIDPQGERAYVAHGNGEVSVVNLQGANPFQVQDVATGGSLRGIAMTPGGSYLYATDRDLDNVKIVDLIPTNGTFRTVVEDFPATSNPVDIAISSDGLFAFSVLQGGNTPEDLPRLLVTTIGLGPQVKSIYPTTARVGDTVVIGGDNFGDFQDFEIASVDFNGVVVPVLQQTQLSVVAEVPVGATSGPVRVLRSLQGSPPQRSNSIPFRVLSGATPGSLRDAGTIETLSTELRGTLAINPAGDLLFVGDNAGSISIIDIRAGSPSFYKTVSRVNMGSNSVVDMAVTADGKSLFVIANADAEVKVLNVDRASPEFAKLRSSATGPFSPHKFVIRTSPDNKYALVSNYRTQTTTAFNEVVIIDHTGLADGATPTALQQVGVGDAGVTDIAIHPSGLVAYFICAVPNMILMVTLDPNSIEFGLVQAVYDIPGSEPTETPMSASITPDGTELHVLTRQEFAPTRDRSMFVYPISPLGGLQTPTRFALEAGVGLADYLETFQLSPRGDRGLRVSSGNGFFDYFLGTPASNFGLNTPERFQVSQADNEFEFSPDGNRVFVASQFTDDVHVYDYLSDLSVYYLAKASGDAQSGAVNQTLIAPVRVRLIGEGSAAGLVGTPVSFTITGGGGKVAVGEQFLDEYVTATDADGYAQAGWRMGPSEGPQTMLVKLTGSTTASYQQTFGATAVTDPNTLPLAIAEVIPVDGGLNVSATTAVLATFSRPVNPASINTGTFYLRRNGDPTSIAAAFGFSDGNRRISLTPIVPLAYASDFDIVFAPAIADALGGPLSNPGTYVFQVQQPPALSLRSISPPSALPGVNVLISGIGFDTDPGATTVTFAGIDAAVVYVKANEILVRVPPTALSGDVVVSANGQTRSLPFVVLVPTTVPIDDVIASVNTGQGTKSLAVTPDGALCYTVSPDGDVVVPVDVEGQTSYPAIQVGDQPVAIAINPSGTFAYVVNFNSGTASVIDVLKSSGTFNTVVQTIQVGSNPVDIVILPDGDRVVVANASSNDLSIIDGDATSETFNRVIASVNTGQGTKSLAVSPDGTRLYVGTDAGYVVLETGQYGVIASVNTGQGTKSLAVSPDGGLLFVLTTAGSVLVVDVTPGSSTENQVIASVATGQGTKSLAVSPDGTLLYLIQDNSDEVLVLSINVIGGVSVQDPDATSPSFQVVLTQVHAFNTDGSPSDVFIDPFGSGRVFITNGSDAVLTIVNGSDIPQGDLVADIEVTPRTLNLQAGGKYVSGRIELPAAFAPEEIDIATVRLQGTIPAVPGKETYEDADEDGIRELVAKFDRALFQAVLPQGEFIEVTITGIVRGRPFSGVDTIRTIRPSVTHPHSGTHIAPGQLTVITWTSPAGQPVTATDVHVSYDDGDTWNAVATHVPNTGSVSWQVPQQYVNAARVMITLWKDDEIVGQGMSQSSFSITAPVTVRLKSFDIAVEDGTAVLRWQTATEIGMDGFRVARSESETGLYASISPEMIPGSGQVSGSEYEYRDDTLRPNRTYWYKLQEVTPEGVGMEFGPYQARFTLNTELAQNVPNPFNPTTTIKYSIAKDERVSLTVYDVAGRRVRTLVDQQQKADVYRIIWDGSNDAGENVASGMYFYKLVAGKYNKTFKMMLLK